MTYRRILAPTDFSPTATAALRHAAELARTYGAEVIVLHVLPTTSWPTHLFGIGGNLLPDLQQEARRHARERLAVAQQEFGAQQELGSASVRTELREGDVSVEILAAASQHRSDLVVIGTHGNSGIKHLLLGSVAERVVRLCPVPVLTVRGSDGTPVG